MTTPAKPLLAHDLEFTLNPGKKGPFLTGHNAEWELCVRNLRPVARKVRFRLIVDVGTGSQRAAVNHDCNFEIAGQSVVALNVAVTPLIFPGEATVNLIVTHQPFDALVSLQDPVFDALVVGTMQQLPQATRILGAFRVHDAEEYTSKRREGIIKTILAGIATAAAVAAVAIAVYFH